MCAYRDSQDQDFVETEDLALTGSLSLPRFLADCPITVYSSSEVEAAVVFVAAAFILDAEIVEELFVIAAKVAKFADEEGNYQLGAVQT